MQQLQACAAEFGFGYFQDLEEDAFQVGRANRRGRGLNRNRAIADRLGFETGSMQFIGDAWDEADAAYARCLAALEAE